jgi:hypothetical protein
MKFLLVLSLTSQLGNIIRMGSPVTAAPVVCNVPVGTSIQSVIDVSAPGTTFTLCAGVHVQQVIAPHTGDTIQGQMIGSTKLATMSGAATLTGWVSDSGRWYVTGQTQAGDVTGSTATYCIEATHPRCNYPEDVYFDGVQKIHEDALADVGAGEWFFDYAADRIYVGDDPTGATVKTSVTPHVFPVTAGNCTSQADNVVFRDMIVEMYAAPTSGAAVNAGCSQQGALGWRVINVEARFNHGAGIGNDTETWTVNSYVHHNCDLGLVGAGSDILIYNNEIAYNNIMAGSSSATCGHDPFWESGGSKWVFTTNLIVSTNFSHHNYGNGLWTDINNLDTGYYSNIVEDNRLSGIMHEVSYDAVIYGNTLRRNGTGQDFPGYVTGACILVAGSPNVIVTGNTCVDNWQGITGLDDDSRGSGLFGAWNLANLNVHTNTITSSTSTSGAGRTGVADADGTDAFSDGNTFENNDYFIGPNTNYFFWQAGDINETAWGALGHDVPDGSVTRL